MARLLSILMVASFFTPASMPAPLAGIAHVAFRVSDVAKSREFYQKLGLEQSFAFNDPGKPPVSYIKVNDRQFIELYQQKDETQPLGLMHVCYEASDIEALQKDYVARDVKAPEPKKARAGNMLFTIRDPENQVVEFTQYMPGSLHFEDRGKHLGEVRGAIHLVAVTMGVQDIQSERQFYATKLGFEDSGAQPAIKLRVPGSSGEELELEQANPSLKPRIVLAVGNLQHLAGELRGHGVSTEKSGKAISLIDPDGARIILNPSRETQSRKP